jgi:hypothetical protein
VNREAVEKALRHTFGVMDYDLMKSIDDPEDEYCPTWDTVTGVFMDTYNESLEEA